MKLIDDWRQSWRFLSMQLNALASAAVGYVLASPQVLVDTLNSMPPEIRGKVPVLASVILFGLVAFARLKAQGGASGK